MAKYQVDFSGARNIIDPLEGVRNSLQQTNATLGQMIGQDEQRAERLRDEAYRRDALALQQAAAKREADKYNQELADRTFAQKTFAAYNQTPTRDYSALPSQLTDTDRGKAVIEAMSLTPEELANPTMPSAIAKMKNQQILSDEHNKLGQTMLESERFKNAMAATAKGADGMIPLSMQEKLLAMESAERAAMTAKSERAQKAIEELSKDRSELQRAGLKDATTLSVAEIRADSRGSGKSGEKNDPKEGTAPKWDSYPALKKALNEEYSLTGLMDAKNVTKIMDKAEATGMKPDEVNKIVKTYTNRGFFDNTFDTEKVLADIEAKKPVLTGGGYAGSNTRAGKFASLDPMAGYAELLKQKDAAYRQAVANAANMPLTQADVLAAREAKGAAQLDELIAKLGATTSKAEVKPETRNVPAPVTAVEEESVKTEAKQKVTGAKKEFSVKDLFANVPDRKDATAVNEDKTKVSPVRESVERSSLGKPIYNFFGNVIGYEDPVPVRVNDVTASHLYGGTRGNMPKIPQSLGELLGFSSGDTKRGEELQSTVYNNRLPIPKSEMMKLSDSDIQQLLKRSDLSDAERKLAGQVLDTPRKPASTQNVNTAIFDIVKSKISPTEKLEQLRALGVPTAQAQQLAYQ